MKQHIRTLRSKKLHPEHVKLINEAIRHNARGKEKDLHITYRKENGEESERKVRPLAVKGKSLFVAHCHERNAIRSFRVERIGMVKSAFWDGFEKRALIPEYNLKNVMLAGIPLGALVGAIAKKHTDNNPDSGKKRNAGLHPAIFGALIGPTVMAGHYGLTKLVQRAIT
jgi:hypothetical protein